MYINVFIYYKSVEAESADVDILTNLALDPCQFEGTFVLPSGISESIDIKVEVR